jgi:hypothetical protein
MAKLQSRGKCNLCGGTFAKAAMSTHLKKCLKQDPSAGSAGGTRTRLFHLVVQGKHDPFYWLHLEVPAQATLDDLDAFLRAIWLECCGHLSAFTIGQTRYTAPPPFEDPFGDFGDDEDTDIELGKVLRPQSSFGYEYDFGSTTELSVKVVGEREGEVDRKKPIRILARNDPPAIPCGKCGQPATVICTQHSYEPGGWLCKSCGKRHKCDEEMFLPVVNSPRTGVCGYTGE